MFHKVSFKYMVAIIFILLKKNSSYINIGNEKTSLFWARYNLTPTLRAMLIKAVDVHKHNIILLENEA